MTDGLVRRTRRRRRTVLLVGCVALSGFAVMGSPTPVGAGPLSSVVSPLTPSDTASTAAMALGASVPAGVERSDEGVRRLMPGARRASEVRDRLSQQRLRARNATVSDHAFESALQDDSAWVDGDGNLFYVDSDLADSHGAEPERAGPVALYPPEDTFTLHSRPGAQRTIYLDFDGGLVSGTLWNQSVGTFIAPAFSIDDDSATFSIEERSHIQEVWARVADDFAAFEIDVTTEAPPVDALRRSGSLDRVYGSRVMFSDEPRIFGARPGSLGVAYLGVFNRATDHDLFQPAWAMTHYKKFAGLTVTSDDGLIPASVAGRIASHELGHNLGLSHDGLYGAEYHGGDPSRTWAPIMGGAAKTPIIQWSRGDYAGATNKEDDYAVMGAHGAPRRSDDHGNLPGGATFLSTSFETGGLIGTPDDVDYFAVDLSAGAFTVTGAPVAFGHSLDILLELRDSSGALLASADPDLAPVDQSVVTGLGATITTVIPAAGRYYVVVRNSGKGDGASVSYARYGSIGRYELASRQPTVTIGVERLGAAGGTISSAVGGLDGCASECSATVLLGTQVDLAASAPDGSRLRMWSNGSRANSLSMRVTSLSTRLVASFEATPKYLVTVSRIGSGAGRVESEAPGILCGDDCSESIEDNLPVVLTAVPSPGSAFVRWNGAESCSTAVVCTLGARTGPVTVTAEFAPGFTLAVTRSESLVQAPEIGYQCYGVDPEVEVDPACTTTVASGTKVFLEPTGVEPWAFSSWGGDCTGAGFVCELTMNGPKSVSASFVYGTALSLSVYAGYTGSGAALIEFSPKRAPCEVAADATSSYCDRYFAPGTTVTLTALARSGRVFVGWPGGLGSPDNRCSPAGKALTCTFQMPDESVVVEAEFDDIARYPFRIDATVSGSGTGTVASDVSGLECSKKCSAAFDPLSLVTLTAVPGDNSSFTGWSGSCIGRRRTCVLRISRARSVVARFVNVERPSAPLQLSARPSNRAVMLSWSAPTRPGGASISDYVVEFSRNGGPWTRVRDGVSVRRSFVVRGLANGASYRFRVAAKNRWGTGVWAESPEATPRTVPGAPKALLVVAGDGEVLLSWVAGGTGGSPVLDYVIQYSRNGRTWTTFADEVSDETAVTVSGLTNGAKYWFRVASVNAAGTGPRSLPKTAVPVVPPVPAFVFLASTHSAV